MAICVAATLPIGVANAAGGALRGQYGSPVRAGGPLAGTEIEVDGSTVTLSGANYTCGEKASLIVSDGFAAQTFTDGVGGTEITCEDGKVVIESGEGVFVPDGAEVVGSGGITLGAASDDAPIAVASEDGRTLTVAGEFTCSDELSVVVESKTGPLLLEDGRDGTTITCDSDGIRIETRDAVELADGDEGAVLDMSGIRSADEAEESSEGVATWMWLTPVALVAAAIAFLLTRRLRRRRAAASDTT